MLLPCSKKGERRNLLIKFEACCLMNGQRRGRFDLAERADKQMPPAPPAVIGANLKRRETIVLMMTALQRSRDPRWSCTNEFVLILG